MAVTPNFSIPLYTTANNAKLDTLLNGHATALDTNLKAGVENAQTSFSGTEAERGALTAPKLRDGISWYATDTRRVWLREAGAWVIAPRLLGWSFVQPASEQIMATALTTVSGLSLTGMPTGIPMLLEVTVQAANGQWGTTRRLDVQAMNGSTAVGPARKFALAAKGDETVGESITHFVPVDAPTSGSWSLKLGCDLGSAVVFWQASLRLYHRM